MSTSTRGPPYAPQTWSLGGTPNVHVDVPITSVFVALYIGGAAAHQTILQLNRRRGHKFLLSILLFGFCMARIITCTLRIASICIPENIRLGIAATIFTALGVILLIIVNLTFAQRCIRATQPRLGWTTTLSWAFKAFPVLIIITVAMLITAIVQTYYTKRENIRRIDRAILLYGETCFAILSFAPIPLILTTILVPRSEPLDKFGTGRWRSKVAVLLVGSTLITLGASYRAGTTWLTPVPKSQPLPKVLGKGPFYVVDFGVEIFTVYLYAISRVDQRFHVPDNAKIHKSFARARDVNQSVHLPHPIEENIQSEDSVLNDGDKMDKEVGI